MVKTLKKSPKKEVNIHNVKYNRLQNNLCSIHIIQDFRDRRHSQTESVKLSNKDWISPPTQYRGY
jgi:hypothetical protein